MSAALGGVTTTLWLAWLGALPDLGPSLPVISREPKELHGADGYVGSAACVECHAAIARSFAEHPMARSLLPVAQALTIEDYSQKTTFAPEGPRRYRVERTAEGVWHHEQMLASAQGLSSGAAETLYDQGVEISYAIGSGAHGRGYLIERDGQFFASSISWYSKSARWDLSPGYAPQKHQRFERAVQEECLFCHAGRTAPAQPESSRYADPPFHEVSIGCERCHGPGRGHLEEQEGRGTGRREAIVNPARLDHERRDSVCCQCHLHGEARVVRFGKHLSDFRPGQLLDEVVCGLVRPAPPEDQRALRAVSQVEQMMASTCYVKSNGAMGCISCHDPHAAVAASDRASAFRQRCLVCHSDRGCSVPEAERAVPPMNDSCIDCHMPPMGGGGIPHTAQTDHRIQRWPTAVRETAPLDPGSLLFFDDADRRLPEWEQWRTLGIALVDLGNQREDRVPLAARAEKLLRQALEHAPEDVEMLHRLGGACLAQSRPSDALQCWERALAREPDRAETLLVYALLCNMIGQDQKAARAFERFIRLNPSHSEAYGQYAGLLAKTGNWERAVKMAEKALDLDPTWVGMRKLLADGYSRIDRGEASRKQRQIIRQMEALGPVMP